MKFSAKEDVEAPIEFVFGEISDFSSLERSALRRGAEVQRVDSVDKNGIGMKWDVNFEFRSKLRKMRLELVHYDPPNSMSFASKSHAILGDLDVELVALSRTRTRLTISTELRPQNLSARLMVQSLKLARGSLSKRFDSRIATYARDMEERHHRKA